MNANPATPNDFGAALRYRMDTVARTAHAVTAQEAAHAALAENTAPATMSLSNMNVTKIFKDALGAFGQTLTAGTEPPNAIRVSDEFAEGLTAERPTNSPNVNHSGPQLKH